MIFPIIHEGTADTFETTFVVINPTADRTVTFPCSGEASLLGQTINGSELDSASVRDQLEAVLRLAQLTEGTLGDAKIDDTITASNYLPLVGGTLTGQLQLDNLGIRFEASPTHPACSSGIYAIFADSVTGELRKCTNGVVSNLDTVGGAASDAAVTTAVSLATCRYVGDASFGRCEWAAGGEVYSAAVNAAKTTIYTSDIFMGTEDMHIRNAALDACATFDSVTGLLTFNTTGTCERPMISRPFDAAAFNAEPVSHAKA